MSRHGVADSDPMELLGHLYSLELPGRWRLDASNPEVDLWKRRDRSTVSVTAYSAPAPARIEPRLLERDAHAMMDLALASRRAVLPEGSRFGTPRWSDEEEALLGHAEATTVARSITSIVMAAKLSVDGRVFIATLTVDTDRDSDLARDVLQTLMLGPADDDV